MKRRNWIVSGGLIALLLPAGCAATDNPSEGGFGGGVYGLLSGGYDRRLQERQARLGGAQLENQYLTVDNRQLGNEAGETAAKRKRLRQQLFALNARTKELTAQTGRMQAGTDAMRGQRAELDNRLSQVKADLARLEREVDQNRMNAEDAQREETALQKELDQLKAAVDALP